MPKKTILDSMSSAAPTISNPNRCSESKARATLQGLIVGGEVVIKTKDLSKSLRGAIKNKESSRDNLLSMIADLLDGSNANHKLVIKYTGNYAKNYKKSAINMVIALNIQEKRIEGMSLDQAFNEVAFELDVSPEGIKKIWRKHSKDFPTPDEEIATVN